MPINLVTLQEYKAHMGLSNPNQDFSIEGLIPKVSALVKNYCNNSFVDHVSDPKLQHFNGGTSSLILDESPVLEILSVEYSNSFGQMYTPLAEYVDYVQDREYILSVNPAGFARQLRGYRVTYLAGYEELPEDLKLAVFDLITYYLRNDAVAHSSKAPNSNSVQIEYIASTTLPAHIRRVLDLHKADFA
jgi:hypothetical protein